MKRLLLLLASVTFLTSCMTDSKLARLAKERGICPTVSDSVTDKSHTTVTKRDTDIVEPEKDGPQVVINLGDNCDSIKARLDSLEKHPRVIEKNGIKATTTYDSKKKEIVTNITEDAHKIHLRQALVTIEVYKEWTEKLTKMAYCDKPHLKPWQERCIWGFFILIAIIIVRFVSKITGYRIGIFRGHDG